MSVGFDTLRAAEALTRAGVAETHARAIVATVSDAIGDQVATKSDIAGMNAEIAGLKTDVAGLKTDVAGLKTDVAGLKTDVAAVRTEIAESKAALTWRIVLALGVFAALTRIMP